MHEQAFQALKRTFMHVPIFLDHILIFKKKTNTFLIAFFNQNMVGEDLRYAKTCVLGRFRP